jgi:hypothetical protein
MGSNPASTMDFSVCVVCAFFCVCVQVEALRLADYPSKKSCHCPRSSN